MKNLLISIVFLVAVYGCTNKPTGITLMPEMAATDSLDIVFFKSPDSLRYFTYTPSTNKKTIELLVTDIYEPVVKKPGCKKEGKIYCYKKGAIFNTIFFRYQQEDSCNAYLSFIKNGNQYYFAMSNALAKDLQQYKTIAKEPVTAQ